MTASDRRDTPLRIVSISDIHLGERRLGVERICQNLETYLFPKLAECDLLVIAGDVFDTGLGLPDPQTHPLVGFVFTLLAEAAKYNLVVRVLRGTHSHDRTQSELFATVHKSCRFTNDFRYVDKITLEEIPSLGIRIGYLPDDLPYPSAEAVIAHVKDQMSDLGWDSVDYMVTHGYYDHHIAPEMPHRPRVCFNETMFDFVTRLVFNGHVHTGGQKGKILTNGSFERLCHGEEHAKGFLHVVDDGADARISFIENKGSTVFSTLDLCATEELEEVVQRYHTHVQSFPTTQPAHIRVLHPNTVVRGLLARLTNQTYPHIRYTFQPPKDAKLLLSEKMPDVLDSAPTLAAITPDTLPGLVVAWQAQHGRKPMSEARVAELLASV
jgi:hypothetical protein